MKRANSRAGDESNLAIAVGLVEEALAELDDRGELLDPIGRIELGRTYALLSIAESLAEIAETRRPPAPDG
jgi:hypothetical protein